MLLNVTILTQVLVWKTNFDVADQQEVLRAQRKRVTPTSHPHTHDPPPQSHSAPPQNGVHELDGSRPPLDHVTAPPNVVNVGPQLFHKPHPPDVSGAPPTDQSGVSQSQTTPLERMTMSPQLATTLEHIVGQLDILTQV